MQLSAAKVAIRAEADILRIINKRTSYLYTSLLKKSTTTTTMTRNSETREHQLATRRDVTNERD